MAMIEIVQAAIKPLCYDAYVEFKGPRGKAMEQCLHLDYLQLASALTLIGNRDLAFQIDSEVGIRNHWLMSPITDAQATAFREEVA